MIFDKNKTNRIRFCIVVLLALWLGGCYKGTTDGLVFNKPDISLRSLVPTGIEDGKLKFDIGLNVKNNNKYLIDLTSLVSTISLNDVAFLQAENSEDFEPIEANSEGVITLHTSLDGPALKKLVSTFNWKTLDYKFQGKMGVNNLINVPVSKEGTVDIQGSMQKFLPYLGGMLL